MFAEVECRLKCGSCSPPLLTSIADHVTLAVDHMTLGVGHVTLDVGHANGHVTVVYFWEGERGGVVGGVVGRVDEEWQVYRQLF